MKMLPQKVKTKMPVENMSSRRIYHILNIFCRIGSDHIVLEKTFLDTFPIKFRPKFCTLPSRVSSTAKFFCNYCGQQLKSGPPLQLSDTLTGYLGLTFGCWVRCQGFPRILGWNPQLDLHVSPICHAVMLNSKCHPHIYSPYSPSWFSLRV